MTIFVSGLTRIGETSVSQDNPPDGPVEGRPPQRDVLALAQTAPDPETSKDAHGAKIARLLTLKLSHFVAGGRAVSTYAARHARAVGLRLAGRLPAIRRSITKLSARMWRAIWLGLSRIRLRHVLGVLSVATASVFSLLAYSIATLPLDGGLVVTPTPSALTLEAEDGRKFATRGVFKGVKLAAADLPDHLKAAVIAIEDRRFYEHIGVDLRGILRAAWRNWQGGGTREGGSTITQQLARLMFLSSDQNLRRKVQEALLALWIERKIDKQEILLRYLNTAYFGAGAYGVDAAARRYFDKPTRDLSLAEAAMLAGLVRAPSQLAPTRNLGGAKERANTVLLAMLQTKAITEQQAAEARAAPLVLRIPTETPPGANYFVDMVEADTRRVIGVATSDLTLRTTIDLELQRVAEGVIARRLDKDGSRKNVSQVALIALAPDGAIKAMVGGRDYEASQFNRVTQAKRQAGSAFKLFVYLAALQKGYTPQSIVVDEPTQIGDWEPQNASGRFRGRMPLRSAFAQSSNSVAAQLGSEIGIPNVIALAKKLGVKSELPSVPSLALGSAEVTLLEMTRAYAVVATGSEALEPYAVRSIHSDSQKQLFNYVAPGPIPVNSFGESRAMMLELLQAVVQEGTGKSAKIQQAPVGGKTGTTQEHRDAWFIGFTPELTVGIWLGNDDNSSMESVTGGGLPAEIFHDFLSQAVAVPAKMPAPSARNSHGGGLSASGPTLSAETRLSQITAAPAPKSATPAIRGVPEVLDTGTLLIGGAPLQLEGVSSEGGTAARQLARFLRRREISCSVGENNLHRCQIDGEDLAEIIISAGGARATPDAPAHLLASENQARSARLGIWRRQR